MVIGLRFFNIFIDKQLTSRVNNDPIELHKKLKGKIEIKNKIFPLRKEQIKLVYTPGVSKVSKQIVKKPNDVYELTSKGNNVAIISDGSRLLGLGDVGPEAALPVMEGKSLLYKRFGDINADPICIKPNSKENMISTIESISPSFGAINIEDMKSPQVLEITNEVAKKTDIPIFHDDQHGTSVITLAALVNALQIVDKKINEIKIIIAGAGSAGYGIVRLLDFANCKNIVVLDSTGAIYQNRSKNMDKFKKEIAGIVKNTEELDLESAIKGADVFIGVSGVKNLLKPSHIKKMAKRPIVFALTNPYPEITPSVALKSGAKVAGTGSYEFSNPINNAVVFPYLMRALLDLKIKNITLPILYSAAIAISNCVSKRDLSVGKLVPELGNRKIQKKITKGIKLSKKF